MAKKFKSKKIKKKTILKIIFFLIFIYLTSLLTYNFLFKKFLSNKINNENLINYLINNTINESDKKNINAHNIFNLNFNRTSSLINKSLNNIVKSDEYFDNNDDEEYEYEKLETKTEYFKDPNPTVVDNPIVYIYNTHQLENYAATYLSSYNIEPNVLMASYLLKEKLNDLNVLSIVEEEDITNLLRINNWKYSYSYKASRYFIDNALKNNPTIKYIIDVHRDSISRDKTTITIANVNYAKLLFLIGLENPNYESNLNVANRMCEIINENYNNLCKGIYKKGGKGVNGVYNQDALNTAMLIEVGGVENTIDEVANSIDAFSKSFYKYLKENS